MTFVVTDACIRCKYMDCVEVCPTGAFREGANMLVIDPNDCTDCNACLPECPEEAILFDFEPGARDWIEINARYAAICPEISRRKDPPRDADDFRGMESKFGLHFSPEPGEGD